MTLKVRAVHRYSRALWRVAVQLASVALLPMPAVSNPSLAR